MFKRKYDICCGALIVLCTMVMASCASSKYYINAETHRESPSEHVLYWEVQPSMDGTVEIYASSDALHYPDQPFMVTEISKATTTYSSDVKGYFPTYFLLVFNGVESRVVSSRIIPTQAFLNLRDVGGYINDLGEQVHWGRLYRSGDLHRAGEMDRYVIASLGIRNQYVLSPSRVRPTRPMAELGISTLTSTFIPPDVAIETDKYLEGIYNGEITVDMIRDIQDNIFETIAFENRSQISTILHTLADVGNYPILLSDDLGTETVSFVVMLVQHILGVSRMDIQSEYLLSNGLVPVEILEPRGFDKPIEVQEALTEYYRSESNCLNNIIDKIEKRYGSLDEYIIEYLRFDETKQEKLRRILLY